MPILVDDDRWVADSWIIANYLEDTYPERPSLFGGTTGRALSRFYSILGDALVSSIFRFIALDILPHLHDKDRAYFRSSREDRVGMPLEAFVADRDARVSAFRESPTPLRLTLRTQPFLG